MTLTCGFFPWYFLTKWRLSGEKWLTCRKMNLGMFDRLSPAVHGPAVGKMATLPFPSTPGRAVLPIAQWLELIRK
jgi:hypothetical protein